MRTPIALAVLALMILWFIFVVRAASKLRRKRGYLSIWQTFNLDILVLLICGKRISDIFKPEMRHQVQRRRERLLLLNGIWTVNLPEVVQIADPEAKQNITPTTRTVPSIPLAHTKSDEP